MIYNDFGRLVNCQPGGNEESKAYDNKRNKCVLYKGSREMTRQVPRDG